MEPKSKQIVSVIVVAAGAHGYLESCLSCVDSQTHPHLEKILIANSAPRRAQILEISSRHLGWKIIELDSAGYGQALNRGITDSWGEFILCLNDDVLLDPGFLSNALCGFAAGPKIGMVSGRIVRMDYKTLDTAGLGISLFGTASERGYGLPEKGRFNRPGQIFGVCGCAAFYNRLMLEEIKGRSGYFDERFRYFYEDLDISWRANACGWRGYYVPDALARHARGATARNPLQGKSPRFARRSLARPLHIQLIRNRYLCLIKNASIKWIAFHLPFLLVYDLVVFFLVLFSDPGLLKAFPRIFAELARFASAKALPTEK